MERGPLAPKKGKDNMKYTVMRACGHEEGVTLFGNTRDRERKLEWLAGCKCKACQEAEAEAKILRETKERELPELTGSPKQIDWAAGIRIRLIKSLEERFDYLMESIKAREEKLKAIEENDPDNTARIEKAHKGIGQWKDAFAECQNALEAIYGIQEAHWWIDHRDCEAKELVGAYKELGEKEKEQAVLEEEWNKMAVMEPDTRQTETVVTIEARNGLVQAICEKDEVIRLKLKAIGFSWDSDRRFWAKAITEKTGTKENLLPDTARKLLKAGIQVRVEPWIKDAVESGSYEPECYRWVSVSKKEATKLFINKVEGVALPSGCKTTWNGDGIISPSRWREVREFAALNGYKVTQKAEAMLNAAEDATVKVKVADKEEATSNGQDALRAILESSRDVLEDLKEEED